MQFICTVKHQLHVQMLIVRTFFGQNLFMNINDEDVQGDFPSSNLEKFFLLKHIVREKVLKII